MIVKEFQEKYHNYKTTSKMEAVIDAIKLRVVDESGKERKIIPVQFGDEWCLMLDSSVAVLKILGVMKDEMF